MITGMPMGAVQATQAVGPAAGGLDPNMQGMMGTIGKMLATPQGQEQVINQLAQMGPPPPVPMAQGPAPGVGPALGGMQQGLGPSGRMPVFRGEAQTNPPGIGAALGGGY